ncbi:MAG: type III polyketide synthase [Myxococcota bacterium]
MPGATQGINPHRHKALARSGPTLDAASIEPNDAKTRLVGLGTAVPPHRCRQQDIAAFMARVAEAQVDCPPRFARYVHRLSRTSAIGHRHTVIADYACTAPEEFDFFPSNWALTPSPTTADRMALYREKSIELAENAARRALADADIPAEAITHVVVSTCTGFFAPGPDVMLMERLGLAPHVQRSILGFMGCYAGINGLRAADHIVRAEPDAVVLQVAVELCSLHFQSDADLKHLVSNLLFADGAAAAVYRREPSPQTASPAIARTASSVSHDTRDQMGWNIGDHGFVMHLAASVPAHLQTQAPQFVDALLAPDRLLKSDVAGWVVHPGGKRILTAIGQALRLTDEDLGHSFAILHDYGNMSSATVLFVLRRLMDSAAGRVSGPAVALSFGPGLTMEGALLVP